MTKVTVSYEFDYYEDQSALKQLMAAQDAHSALWDVDQELRNRLKHGNDEWLNDEGIQNYLEKLREMIWDSGVFKDD